MNKNSLALFAAAGIIVAAASAAIGQSVSPKAKQPNSTVKEKSLPMTTATPISASAAKFDGLMGGQIDLTHYRGKVVLVVNTASQCGYTGQYSGLEALYKARQRDGLVIVGVPSNDFGGQEPGSAAEIKKFCELNYGVTFPMAAKSVVRGSQAHPFYRAAVTALGPTAEPKWNFHKILIDKDGKPIAAFASSVTPQSAELSQAITRALSAR